MRGLIIAFVALANAAQADVVVEFRDGAPKDTFTITNTGSCPLPPLSLQIDLSTASVGLIVDVTADGAGVDVFQPFEIVQGDALVEAYTLMSDGDQMLQMDLYGMPADAVLRFTIDLDDTGGGREITVSGSEIAGARVIAATDFRLVEGLFDESGTATVLLSGCAA